MIKFISLKEKLKTGFFPLLVVYGNDLWLKEKAIENIVSSLNITVDFNVSKFNEAADVDAVFLACSTLPFIDSHRAVIVDMNMPQGKKGQELKERLEKFALHPQQSCCLVINTDNPKPFESVKGVEIVDCTKLDTENIRIPSHIPVDAQWDIISVNGEMNLELYNIGSSYNWNYLIVDKLSGSNIFRVHLPMNQDEYIVQELRNYGLELESDGTYYLYFTVTPSNSVAILPNESWTGFMYDSEPTYFMSKWNGYADTNGESYYNLSVETVLSYGNDDFMKKDISDGSIWLHFDIADESMQRYQRAASL